jgi:pimeloyl-ACP methyl ester carboxylesterase
MTRLGYDRFAVHGGDIGAAVSPEVGRVAPERVIGVHVNGALGFAANVDDDALAAMTPVERDRVARVGAFMRDEYGYIAIQSTRPGLIGIALADSPAAQLAWMLDKQKAWTYPPAALPDSVLTREWILANASLYWFTASGGSAAYVGYAQAGGWGSPPASSGVPTAAIQFAHDVGIRSSSADANAIVRWTDVNDRGGHFAALEEPELLVDDIRQFLRGVRDGGPTA